MSKSLIIVGAAVVAAATTILAPAAQAGKHGGFHFGGGHHFRHHHHRHIIVTPVYTETYRVKRAPVVQEKKIIVSYADGMGRVYDVASKVWHDGQNHCWTGKLAWTFKNGAWFYGSYRWSAAGGTWSSNAPEAPAAVDCQTVPAFAAKVAPTVSQSQKEFGGYSEQGEPGMAPAPVKTAEKKETTTLALPADGNATRAGECKKYFPNVGEMLPVPCND